jgi:hypothetical protein
MEKLDPTYTRGDGVTANLTMIIYPAPKGVPGDESPVLFKREDTYYFLQATGYGARFRRLFEDAIGIPRLLGLKPAYV